MERRVTDGSGIERFQLAGGHEAHTWLCFINETYCSKSSKAFSTSAVDFTEEDAIGSGAGSGRVAKLTASQNSRWTHSFGW